jgi:hypothetical protein
MLTSRLRGRCIRTVSFFRFSAGARGGFSVQQRAQPFLRHHCLPGSKRWGLSNCPHLRTDPGQVLAQVGHLLNLLFQKPKSLKPRQQRDDGINCSYCHRKKQCPSCCRSGDEKGDLRLAFTRTSFPLRPPSQVNGYPQIIGGNRELRTYKTFLPWSN